MADFIGTSGNDNLTGTGADETFDMSQGGNDIVHGAGGNDTFDFGATLSGADQVFGGTGFDTILMSGGHSVLDVLNIAQIEKIAVADGFSYGFQFSFASIAAGDSLQVDASALTGSHMLDLENQSEDGSFVITGGQAGDVMFTGAGDDVIFGGDGSDSINPGNGTDKVNGGAGDDLIEFTGAGKLDASDRINGGDFGTNRLVLFGNYSAGLAFAPQTIHNITSIELFSGFSYSLTLTNASLPSTIRFKVDGSALHSTDSMIVDGSGQTAYLGYDFIGGAGKDILTGGGQQDNFTGGGGADTLSGRGEQDTFIYNTVAESTGVHYDIVIGFDADADFFDPLFTPSPGAVAGFDGTITQGKLGTTHFNNQLASAIDASALAANHAVLFQPDSGTLAGNLFLIVDGNGVAGYQAGADLVVRLDDAHHMAHFSAANFGTPA